MAPGSPGKYRWLALATVAATYALILFGGVVRVTGSGLGCPDWPLCHGQVVPPLDGPTLVEYGHRLSAAVVSALVLATALLAWRGQLRPWIRVPATLALALLVVQVVLGGITVLLELPATIVVAHLGTSEALLAALLVTTIAAWQGSAWPRPAGSSPDGFWKLAAAAGLGTYVVLLSGAYVAGSGAAVACATWPLCDGAVFLGQPLPDIHMAHRVVVGLVALLVAATVVQALRTQRDRPAVIQGALFLAMLYIAQSAVGAVNVLARTTDEMELLHLATATGVWATLVVLAALAYGDRGTVPAARPGPGPSDRAGRRLARQGERSERQAEPAVRYTRTVPAPDVAVALPGSTVVPGSALVATWGAVRVEAQLARASRRLAEVAAAYAELTKPRIVVLLLITTLAAMLLASPPWPRPVEVLATIVGGYLAAGGANALNNFLDRDIDVKMRRTRRRPLPSHRIAPRQALRFGVALGAISFVLFAVFVNVLAGALAVLGLLYYVFVYTRLLKRTTPQNIVIGGAAGAIPPLVGWAAATGSLALPAFLLFATIFLWTPPHFWSLSLYTRADYEAAGIPMLPIVAGEAEARRQILVYSIVLVAVTPALFFAGAAGWLYLGAAALLGAGLVANAVRLQRDASVPAARRMFLYSNVYLALLFLSTVLDHLLLARPA